MGEAASINSPPLRTLECKSSLTDSSFTGTFAAGISQHHPVLEALPPVLCTASQGNRNAALGQVWEEFRWPLCPCLVTVQHKFPGSL